jgi:hypothetical protein
MSAAVPIITPAFKIENAIKTITLVPSQMKKCPEKNCNILRTSPHETGLDFIVNPGLLVPRKTALIFKNETG